MDGGEKRRVAIACQGGGSHTAFTAGVLSRLLRAEELDAYRVVGFSGTSGGAICALLAWNTVRDGTPARAGEVLKGFWADNAASTPAEALVNIWSVGAATMQSLGLLPVVSPYAAPVTGVEQFRELLERWVDFSRIDVDPTGHHALFVVGAVDVLTGKFRAFHSRRDRVTADVILASAAIPTLFRAVHIGEGVYWDGLFSQNPPVRELLDAEPDELWVIQINPTERDSEPRGVLDIADRRNELSGNLSLYQELHVIEKINELLAEGLLQPGGKYKQVVVRVIELARSRLSRLLGPASKLNRAPAFIAELIAQGERQAEEFLTALTFEQRWRRGDIDALLRSFADDVKLTSAAPFPQRGPLRGEQVREFVREDLAQVRMDLTHKQLARDRVVWSVQTRTSGADATAPAAVSGRAEAEFRDGRLVRLRLDAPPTR
ncbi:MAG TPA: patatin-like phospholipase family protein [Mycobacteriales bacterium]|nr:patatin-like phospholipase family protein [Mycobacteriales bacterium]